MDKKYVLGADEVGYGSLAGPLVIGGVRAEKTWNLQGLKDSKQLTDKQRRKLNEELLNLAEKGDITYNFEKEEAWSIDNQGVLKSLQSCYTQTAIALYGPDTLMIIDGQLDFSYLKNISVIAVPKADTIYQTVMAASVMAKVYRDDLMIDLAKQFPYYDWESNKGYGSKSHKEGIKKYGFCNQHRKSYKIKNL